MALGLSGSNGGVSNVYRAVAVADISSGIEKYKALYEQIEGQIAERKKSSDSASPKELSETLEVYANIIIDLETLKEKIRAKEGLLVQKVGG